MGRPPLFIGARVILRVGRRPDIVAILDYFKRNRPHLAPWSPIPPHGFLTRGYWETRLRRDAVEFREDRSLRMFVFDQEAPGRVIGVVNFSNIIRGAFQS